MQTISEQAAFYVVATPLGNLRDISLRALDVLSSVERVLAEDTRHSKKLIEHFGVDARLESCFEHNEHHRARQVIQWLSSGERLALISDAGTPLISDPGLPVIKAVIEAGYPVISVPGPCAAITALCVSGLPTDAFLYLGFLPATAAKRRDRLLELKGVGQTLVFYESKHRLLEMLEDCGAVLGERRSIAVCRELTKQHEWIYRGSIGGVIKDIQQDPNGLKGEFVVVIEGRLACVDALPAQLECTVDQLIEALRVHIPDKQIAQALAKLSDVSKRRWYEHLLQG